MTRHVLTRAINPHSEIEAPLENEINVDFTLLQQHPLLHITARRVPLPPSRMWAGVRQLRLERRDTTRTAASRQLVRATSPPADDERERAAHGTPPSNQRSARDTRHTARLGTQSRTTRRHHRELASECRRRGRAAEGEGGRRGRGRRRVPV
jgi:hypothetical protein